MTSWSGTKVGSHSDVYLHYCLFEQEVLSAKEGGGCSGEASQGGGGEKEAWVISPSEKKTQTKAGSRKMGPTVRPAQSMDIILLEVLYAGESRRLRRTL
jgi:hypothetical protein